MRRSAEAQLAYFAGLMDGEGSFSIQVRSRVSTSGRTNVDLIPKMSLTLYAGGEVLDEMVEVFGGAVSRRANERASGIESRWNLCKRVDLIDAASSLHPHLRVKRVTCERFLHALSIFPTSRKAHGKGQRSWTADQIVEVAHIAYTLNAYGKRHLREFSEAELRAMMA